MGKKVLNASRRSEYNSDKSYVHCGGHGDYNCEAELQLRVDVEGTYASTRVLKDRLPKIMQGVIENAKDEPGREFPFNTFITEVGVVRHPCDTFLKHAKGKQPPPSFGNESEG